MNVSERKEKQKLVRSKGNKTKLKGKGGFSFKNEGKYKKVKAEDHFSTVSISA
ncbi:MULTISPECIES: hypothetical protein [unclassified Methanosarcina]|uniref:hypothetical protein n=1 Tax=unclassified Methanosarcina TaxID=2644672 RepID=UPI0012E07510|nr:MULTISPECIES: hypothetical protein [unclassified Methanosarcina]